MVQEIDKMSPVEQDNTEFVKVFSAKANDIHPVTKYRSKRTGMEIVHAEIEGPMVNGYIVLGKLKVLII